MSVGGVEVIILAVVVVLLFGPTLLAFWLGYNLGKKRSTTEEAATPPEPDGEDKA